MFLETINAVTLRPFSKGISLRSTNKSNIHLNTLYAYVLKYAVLIMESNLEQFQHMQNSSFIGGADSVAFNLPFFHTNAADPA